MRIVRGERISRGQPLLLGVSAVIFDAAGRVLLTRRTDNGLWCLPGGALETGESVSEALRREVLEETGLDVEPTRLIGVYSDPHRISEYADGNRYHVVVLSFLCRAVGGELSCFTAETTGAGYFAPAALPPLVEVHHQRIEDALRQGGEAVIA